MPLLDRLPDLLGLGFDFDVALGGARFDRVAPRLLVGARPRPEDLPTLREHGVTDVVSCLPPAQRDTLGFLSPFRAHFLPLQEHVHQDIASCFPRFFDVLARAEGAVLVRCEVGVSRSATLATAHAMHTDDLRFDEAYRRVRSRRPQALPNIGFASQLQRFEHERHPPRADGPCSLTWYLDEVCNVPAEPSVIEAALADHGYDAFAAVQSIFGDIPRVVQGVRVR